MSQPRYAAAGITRDWKGVSLRGALFGTAVAALAVMLAAPALIPPPGRAAAATAKVQAVPAGAAARPLAAGDSIIRTSDIHPSAVGTAVPGPIKAKPVVQPIDNGGLVGPAGETGALGIPTMVLKAYKLAADQLGREQPSCHLPWWLLAGIGHTESGHAESGRLYADGTTRGRILGPVLNGGIAGDAVITDTDHGVYDGDTKYDRAVGPMQFIPSTWKSWGADGNHDGKRDPNNIFDATLAAGRYLCADGRNLSTTAGLQAAVLSYNHSQAYLDTVLAWGYAYRSGASAVPDQSVPVVGDVTKVRPPVGAKPPSKPRPLPTRTSTASTRPSAPSTTSSTGGATSSGSTSGGSSGSSSSSGSASASPTCTSAAPSGSSTSTSTAGSASAGSGSQTAGTATAQASASADGGSVAAAASSSTASSATSSDTASSRPSNTCTP